jgi:hypothetical protein
VSEITADASGQDTYWGDYPTMKLHFIDEPELEFGRGKHICPRTGITQCDVYDSRLKARREAVLIGAVGTSETLEKLAAWVRRCEAYIAGPPDSRQPTLNLPFCGFNPSVGFKARLVLEDEIMRPLLNSEVKAVTKIPDLQWNKRVEQAVELYYNKIKFLAQNRQVDVVVCVLPKELFLKLTKRSKKAIEPTIEAEPEDDAEDAVESNFRRALKARAMHLGKPLQLVQETSLEASPRGKQDDATRAWDFCTALYYKTNKTVPWRLIPNVNRPQVCFAGIGFYRSRDRSVLHTSLAQVFDELGNGVILRGTPVDVNKEDRRPYMTNEQAYTLLQRALQEYEIALDNSPGRLVIHKSSKFNDAELEGFRQATKESRVRAVDFVTILDSRIYGFRSGAYPPLRGTHIEIDSDQHLLYTRGAVPYYRTYPGRYIPQPLDIRIVESDESPSVICGEILALTKMNWNNTQFDGKYPITLQCARKVGEIMKYLGPNDKPEISYSFYM